MYGIEEECILISYEALREATALETLGITLKIILNYGTADLLGWD
jgi:hypothetical protein